MHRVRHQIICNDGCPACRQTSGHVRCVVYSADGHLIGCGGDDKKFTLRSASEYKAPWYTMCYAMLCYAATEYKAPPCAA